jgi:hypothetical protein
MTRWIDSMEPSEDNVRRLITERDLARPSRVLDEPPAYRDPFLQLVGAATAFVSALLWSATTTGVPRTVSQALVGASALLGMAVLLRSVRNGWNVSVYRRARRAMQREVTLRTERDALREVSLRCASLRKHGSTEEALNALQQLTIETHHALERASAVPVSLVVTEEVAQRFLVISVAGYLRARPFYVAPGKSCLARRDFSQLLKSFAPQGQVAVEEVRWEGRQFWVGLTCERPISNLDAGALSTIGAWVSLLLDMDLMPNREEQLRRASEPLKAVS